MQLIESIQQVGLQKEDWTMSGVSMVDLPQDSVESCGTILHVEGFTPEGVVVDDMRPAFPLREAAKRRYLQRWKRLYEAVR